MGKEVPVKLVAVTALAVQCGVHRTTMVRRLVAMHKKHGGDWLVPVGSGEERTRVMVNLARLREVHPGLFEPTKRRNLECDVEELLETVRELRKTVNATRAELRALKSAEAQSQQLHSRGI